MVNKEIFVNTPFNFIIKQIKKLYLNSKIYDRKISRVYEGGLEYIPPLNLLDCVVTIKNKKNRIEDYNIESVWDNFNLNQRDLSKLHSFFWLFKIDLKSSKEITQSVILKWIETNKNYNDKTWDIETLSKRVIAWISNSNNFYPKSNGSFKIIFSNSVKKQINHLMSEIKNSDTKNDKMLSCVAIILFGLSFKNQSKYLYFGLGLLKKIINNVFDNDGFPKSRSLRELFFFIKYFVLIRELINDSNNEVPEYLNEIIFYLGKSYNFFSSENVNRYLFNGNHYKNISDFNIFLKKHGYSFKNTENSIGGYTIFKNKRNSLIVDLGPSPEKNYSKDYQSGALSFEIFHDDEKIITNCGYYQNFKHQLNILSKSSAAHSTLSIDNHSSCKFKKNVNGNFYLASKLNIIKKKISCDNRYWEVEGVHDGYLKKYGILHLRKIKFDLLNNVYHGEDKIICKKIIKDLDFDIRFHLSPDSNASKTQDQKSILIQLSKSGWKFTNSEKRFGLETGLFFGNKDNYVENLNIFIMGEITKEEQTINWEIKKI